MVGSRDTVASRIASLRGSFVTHKPPEIGSEIDNEIANIVETWWERAVRGAQMMTRSAYVKMMMRIFLSVVPGATFEDAMASARNQCNSDFGFIEEIDYGSFTGAMTNFGNTLSTNEEGAVPALQSLLELLFPPSTAYGTPERTFQEEFPPSRALTPDASHPSRGSDEEETKASNSEGEANEGDGTEDGTDGDGEESDKSSRDEGPKRGDTAEGDVGAATHRRRGSLKDRRRRASIALGSLPSSLSRSDFDPPVQRRGSLGTAPAKDENDDAGSEESVDSRLTRKSDWPPKVSRSQPSSPAPGSSLFRGVGSSPTLNSYRSVRRPSWKRRATELLSSATGIHIPTTRAAYFQPTHSDEDQDNPPGDEADESDENSWNLFLGLETSKPTTSLSQAISPTPPSASSLSEGASPPTPEHSLPSSPHPLEPPSEPPSTEPASESRYLDARSESELSLGSIEPNQMCTPSPQPRPPSDPLGMFEKPSEPPRSPTTTTTASEAVSQPTRSSPLMPAEKELFRSLSSRLDSATVGGDTAVSSATPRAGETVLGRVPARAGRFIEVKVFSEPSRGALDWEQQPGGKAKASVEESAVRAGEAAAVLAMRGIRSSTHAELERASHTTRSPTESVATTVMEPHKPPTNLIQSAPALRRWLLGKSREFVVDSGNGFRGSRNVTHRRNLRHEGVHMEEMLKQLEVDRAVAARAGRKDAQHSARERRRTRQEARDVPSSVDPASRDDLKTEESTRAMLSMLPYVVVAGCVQDTEFEKSLKPFLDRSGFVLPIRKRYATAGGVRPEGSKLHAPTLPHAFRPHTFGTYTAKQRLWSGSLSARTPGDTSVRPCGSRKGLGGNQTARTHLSGGSEFKVWSKEARGKIDNQESQVSGVVERVSAELSNIELPSHESSCSALGYDRRKNENGVFDAPTGPGIVTAAQTVVPRADHTIHTHSSVPTKGSSRTLTSTESPPFSGDVPPQDAPSASSHGPDKPVLHVPDDTTVHTSKSVSHVGGEALDKHGTSRGNSARSHQGRILVEGQNHATETSDSNNLCHTNLLPRQSGSGEPDPASRSSLPGEEHVATQAGSGAISAQPVPENRSPDAQMSNGAVPRADPKGPTADTQVESQPALSCDPKGPTAGADNPVPSADLQASTADAQVGGVPVPPLCLPNARPNLKALHLSRTVRVHRPRAYNSAREPIGDPGKAYEVYRLSSGYRHLFSPRGPGMSRGLVSAVSRDTFPPASVVERVPSAPYAIGVLPESSFDAVHSTVSLGSKSTPRFLRWPLDGPPAASIVSTIATERKHVVPATAVLPPIPTSYTSDVPQFPPSPSRRRPANGTDVEDEGSQRTVEEEGSSVVVCRTNVKGEASSSASDSERQPPNNVVKLPEARRSSRSPVDRPVKRLAAGLQEEASMVSLDSQHEDNPSGGMPWSSWYGSAEGDGDRDGFSVFGDSKSVCDGTPAGSSSVVNREGMSPIGFSP
eukprot:Rmarinus@m.5952